MRGRRKRSTSSTSQSSDYNDNTVKSLILEEEDNFVPNLDLTWPTASGITLQQATDRCQQGIESSTVYTRCLNEVIGSDVMDSLTFACREDILVSM